MPEVLRPTTPSPSPTITPSERPLRLSRGINMGNTLEAPRDGSWGYRLQAAYFQRIAEAGFDHVRQPIRWSDYAAKELPYTIEPEFFQQVDWVVEQCTSRNLAVILDMHHYLEIMENPEAHRERFLALWRQIAAHYQDSPDTVLFELLNEPNGALNAMLWNDYLAEAIAIIRQTNPSRVIIIGPTEWNSHAALVTLKLPENDPHLLVTFHYYQPFSFTHQGAEWVNGSASWLGTTWQGTPAEQEAIRFDLDVAARWARQNGRKLLLGEFGAYEKADMASRARWTAFVAREAEARGIAWCYWEFGAGFGAYDRIERKWNEPLLRALIPE
ncbi:MAG: glycoside hydrolase family 5 protein [Chloroflexi bacterium]|nr:glycoside hydrolase family 5 protein [Chloroflexota bacterium]